MRRRIQRLFIGGAVVLLVFVPFKLFADGTNHEFLAGWIAACVVHAAMDVFLPKEDWQ